MAYFIHMMDRLTDKLLNILCFSLLICVFISATNALVRKFLGFSANGFLEIQWVLYSLVFLYGGSVLLKKDGHIRIDIFYDHYSEKTKNILNILLHSILTLPIFCFLFYHAFAFWTSSFMPQDAPEHWHYYLFYNHSHLEWSPNAGGLPTIFAKFLLPSSLILMILQIISLVAKNILSLFQK